MCSFISNTPRLFHSCSCSTRMRTWRRYRAYIQAPTMTTRTDNTQTPVAYLGPDTERDCVTRAAGISVRQRIGPELEMRCQRLGALAAFDQPWRAIAVCSPQAAALPAGVRIVDAAVKALGIEAERIGNADRDHLAVLVEGDEAVHQVGGRHRDVVAKPEGVVLVDPRGVARLGAVLADALEARARILVERPALGAVVAGRLRAVERAFAQAAVEYAHVAARERDPHAPLLVDIAAARAEAGQRDVVLLGQRFVRILGRIDAHDGARAAAQRAPHRTVNRARHYRVEGRTDAHVLGRIHRLARLGVLVAHAVAVGVEHQRGPALRLLDVAGLVEHLGVDPADVSSSAPGARPQRLVGVVAKLQMMRAEAGLIGGVLAGLRIVHRHAAVGAVERKLDGRGM